MHQPYYQDLKTGECVLPWVRLHGVKDYLDMPRLLNGFPKIKQCFNLVPSLLEQIDNYLTGEANDRQMCLSRKKSELLTAEEKKDILESFFWANEKTMIKPYSRYNQLYKKVKTKGIEECIKLFTDQDFLDLQVWFNAVWIDPSLRNDASVKLVLSKKEFFTEDEKNDLLNYHFDILKRIVPTYREMQDNGQIEVSFSPYYHPILPLLIDTDSAKTAMPNMQMPLKRFSHIEDADKQIEMSAILYHDLFKRSNFGMWPSEGSVSEDILPILAKYGITWIATDEEIYYASISNQELSKRSTEKLFIDKGFHRPLLVGKKDQSIGILFRDHKLSDKLGFVYSPWDAEEAADDFILNLKNTAAAFDSSLDKPVIPIILDGENAWEFYANDGIDFLTALYTKLEQDEQFATVLPCELFENKKNIEHLPYLFPGSWINHNFRVWIGHEEDNRAWDLLSETREQLVSFLAKNPNFDIKKKELAWKAIYIAEGSDWCWWYGDEHQTTQFQIFDTLFRRHLQYVWELIGITPPANLMKPIRRTAKQAYFIAPADLITPIIDGKESHFFDWRGAGKLECFKLGSAMHRSERYIHQILFGYDQKNVYFRIDFEDEELKSLENLTIELNISLGRQYKVLINKSDCIFMETENGSAKIINEAAIHAWDLLLELAIPRSALIFDKEKTLYFDVMLKDGKKEVEKWPEADYIFFDVPPAGETFFWQV